jgi:hypothetical protein
MWKNNDWVYLAQDFFRCGLFFCRDDDLRFRRRGIFRNSQVKISLSERILFHAVNYEKNDPLESGTEREIEQIDS